MQNKKAEIQKIALDKIRANKYQGVCVLDMGSGKTKLGIDIIEDGNFKNILIASPRTNLYDSWVAEIQKWGYSYFPGQRSPRDHDGTAYSKDGSSFIKINIDTIQSVNNYGVDEPILSYDKEGSKSRHMLQRYDLIIYDEIHTCGPEFFKVIEFALDHGIAVVGLTGTPNKEDDFKSSVLYERLPIVYEYYDSAKDGLINKRRYFIYKYGLSDLDKIKVGSKAKNWVTGEAKHYEYLTERIKRGQIAMSKNGSANWFEDAANWYWKKEGTKEQVSAAKIYLDSIKYRKEFLWNLSSSAKIALELKEKILSSSKKNKVLLFSELTEQAKKLSKYTITSKNDKELNKITLEMFNNGEIRDTSSVRSLSLGLNMKGANWMIVESYNSSSTDLKQKMGRGNRLDVDDVANVVIIVPINTQADNWYKELIKTIDMDDVTYISDVSELTNLTD